MPELPEVETTVRGLSKEIVGFRILDVWTDLKTKDVRKLDTVSNPKYFLHFEKEVKNKKISSVERRAKNILINLESGKTILVHMKMTGHLLFGEYIFIKKENRWAPKGSGPLADPYNRFIHIVFSLSDKKYLAFSDSRKFGKITLLSTKDAPNTKHLKNLGPEPLGNEFTLEKFKGRLFKKPNGKIKTVLMNQELVAGIGNIYSDEILWLAGIHPERKAGDINRTEFKNMFLAMKKLLKKGVAFGGDSMSDYRNIYGLPGKFQLHHNAYQKKGERCGKRGCPGVIIRKIINNRSAHFCSMHQK